MDKVVFPAHNGIVVFEGGKKVISATNCDGQKKLKSAQAKNKIVYWHFPFIRGIQYFFCGFFGLLCALVDCYDLCDAVKMKKQDLKKYYIKNLFYIALAVLFGMVFGFVVFGLLPNKLAWLCLDFSQSTFLRNLIVLGFKITLFYAFFLILRFLPMVSEFFRFNRAGDVVQGYRSANPLNFLNYFVFVFLLDFVVISLFGASFGFFFNMLLQVAIFIGATSVGYEILWTLEKIKSLRFLSFLTAFLVYAKPTKTHIETASVALNEINLLNSQKGRAFMEGENHAFSVVYSEVKNKLSAAGISDKAETDWLIATVLGKNRGDIRLVGELSEKQYQDIMKVATRRAKGESLDNIFGWTEFYGLRFDVNKKVLTPRMETEILVEQTIKLANAMKNPKILDLGTGSGAIAVALAKNCEDAVVTAIDVSKMALQTAEANAKKNDVKVEFLHSNLFENLKRKRKFDIIVSNPPYIKTEDIKKLDKNVRECDPELALDGGEDGLDFYRAIIPSATKRLTSGGSLLLEVGKGQAAAVRKIMRENGFEQVRTIKDYNKIERIVCGKYS